jgi:hypothetical protein
MKRSLLLFSLLFVLGVSYSQFTMESGSQLIVSSGSTVIADHGIVNNGGTINIATGSTLEIQGDLENNTSPLFENSSAGTIRFNGTTAQEITGDTDAEFYGTIEIDNSTGVTINGSDQTIHGTLKFTNGNLTLGDYDLTLDNDVTTPGTNGYIQTNAAGAAIRIVSNNETPVLFPVGDGAYNPVTLQNGTGATPDAYLVRVVDAEPANSSTDHFVDRSWVVNELVPGGSELTVTPQWNSAEELTDFDNSNCSVGLTTDNGTNYQWGQTSAAAGSDPYTQSGSTFTTVGTFAVGDYYYAGKTLNLKFFLAAAYNGTDMNKTLNTDGLIPLEDPYGLSPDATSIPTDAVDWVTVQLRDATTTSTVVTEFSCFVDVDGNLLDRDGDLGATISGTPLTNYYVSVLHRNHFGVMSSSPINLASSTPLYDFTTGQGQAWQDPAITTNAAMKEVSTGVYGLWNGDANHDGEVQYEGGNPDRVTVLNAVGSSTPTVEIGPIYSPTDVNMDGKIQYEGDNPERVSILNVIGASTPTVAFTAHLPNN